MYTKIMLTLVAALLAWSTFDRLRVPVVQAQFSTYSVEVVTGDWMSKQYGENVAAALNKAANGRELITVIPHDQAGRYLAVYKQQGR